MLMIHNITFESERDRIAKTLTFLSGVCFLISISTLLLLPYPRFPNLNCHSVQDPLSYELIENHG